VSVNYLVVTWKLYLSAQEVMQSYQCKSGTVHCQCSHSGRVYDQTNERLVYQLKSNYSKPQFPFL
jgi:hypothetical protein